MPPTMNMPGENRPDPWNTGQKVTNRELDWLQKLNEEDSIVPITVVSSRIIDGNEEMLPGETCIFFAVTPFGRSIRCLCIRKVPECS